MPVCLGIMTLLYLPFVSRFAHSAPQTLGRRLTLSDRGPHAIDMGRDGAIRRQAGMDIADILASVTRDAHAAHGVPDDGVRHQQDLQLLTRAWVSERVAPELLPYPSELMDRVMTRLRTQVRYRL